MFSPFLEILDASSLSTKIYRDLTKSLKKIKNYYFNGLLRGE